MSDNQQPEAELIALRSAEARARRRKYLDGGGWETVDGWLYLKALRLTDFIDQCQDYLGIRGNIGEIGLYFGKYFILLYLLSRSNESVLGLDLFEDPEWRERFDKNMAAWQYPAKAPVIITANSLDVNADQLLSQAGGPFRLFSVDGGHSMDVALHDLRLANAVLVDGGVVMVDDYFDPKFPGVSEAVNRFFLMEGETCRLAPFLIAGNKLFMTTAPHAGLYQNAIHNAIDRDQEELWQADFLGSNVTTLL